MDELSGKRYIVTGAGSGIGRATAELLAARGASVVAVDMDENGLRDLRSPTIECVTGDVTSAKVRSEIVRVAGECTGLVNSHGIVRPKLPGEVTEANWADIMDVNAKSVFFLSQAVVPTLARGGAIVNVSSISARSGATTEQLVYCASKAAVLAITRGMAHWLGPKGIRVNAILPGMIDTPMYGRVLDDLARARNQPTEAIAAVRHSAIPLEGRPGRAEECAEVILFLVSAAASYITGQSILVDGGVLML